MYQNRWEAGKILAKQLAEHHFESICVFGIPRGGIVTAAPIAQYFNVKLNVLITRKIGHPMNPEFAIGAVMPDGKAILDTATIRASNVSQTYLARTITEQYAELQRRMLLYTGEKALPDITGKTAILVDDGIATGYTMKAAIEWLKTLQPAKIIVAAPVAPPEVIRELLHLADAVICPLQPESFMAVGMHYVDFPQTTDEEAIALLKEYRNDKDPSSNI